MKKFIDFIIYPKVYFAIIFYVLTVLFSVSLFANNSIKDNFYYSIEIPMK